MSNDVLVLVLGGCLLGAIQLLVGLAIGVWVRRPDPTVMRRGKYDLQQAGTYAKRLQTLATEMSSIVDDHCSELQQASQLLAVDGGPDDERIAAMVSNVISEIVHANQGLQAKLDTAESRLQQQAVEIEAHISRSLTDPLTGLPNRREFNERLEERMSAWNRRQEVFSLLMLDVDHFKKLNDHYGHLAGDQVLATLGGVLRGAIRREDKAARYGGEEFAVLLPGTTLSQAAIVAHKIREAILQTIVAHHDHRLTFTVSIGLATIQPGEAVESLIQRADEALYAAKGAGRNCAFAHNGAECLLADGEVSADQANQTSKSPASDLMALIAAPQPAELLAADSSSATFSAFLSRDIISSSLAETCQELRKFLEQRKEPEADRPPSQR
ncbi:MAG: GGDEF domain-containing protein [Pirellulales bacterium]|nr:GGDEF domain-containing protein [Pirellulales bacterium]